MWILKGAESEALSELQERIEREFSSVDEFLELLKIQTGPGRLKSDYLAYEEVARVIGRNTGCRDRAAKLLAAFTKACLGQHDGSSLMEIDDGRSTAQWCARQTGEGWPVKVRRKEGVTNHLHPESCAGRCEAAGEVLTGARTGRAIEHRKRGGLERRDYHCGRRPHRHHRAG